MIRQGGNTVRPGQNKYQDDESDFYGVDQSVTTSTGMLASYLFHHSNSTKIRVCVLEILWASKGVLVKHSVAQYGCQKSYGSVCNLSFMPEI